jgi:hypothetical protein
LRDDYTVSLSQPISIFNQQLAFMDLARIHRDVFPSMHVAISFLVWLYAWRNSRTSVLGGVAFDLEPLGLDGLPPLSLPRRRGRGFVAGAREFLSRELVYSAAFGNLAISHPCTGEVGRRISSNGVTLAPGN